MIALFCRGARRHDWSAGAEIDLGMLWSFGFGFRQRINPKHPCFGAGGRCCARSALREGDGTRQPQRRKEGEGEKNPLRGWEQGVQSGRDLRKGVGVGKGYLLKA